MTNLEFIEKEIENIKEFLSDSVNVIGKNTKDPDFWEQRLQILQQIKTELKAWEVCKKFLTDLGKGYVLSVDSYYNEAEYQILEKALGVKEC